MKVGKEEAIGMLMAVEMWMTRDHKAEWDRWVSWLDHIAKRVSAVEGVTASVTQPEGLSNRTPSLAIRWDRKRLGVSGKTVAQLLFDNDPRVATPGGRDRNGTETGISITPYMMAAGDEKVVADRLYAILRNPPRREAGDQMAAPAADLSGQWDVQIDYAAGVSKHTLYLRQQGNRVEGSHQGDFVSRDLTGTVEGDAVRISSSYSERHGDSLMFEFAGKISGFEITGSLDMGEYLKASWKAKRHEYRRGQGV
jgi:L-seryl-tRNA(Ser) seleniumtransferase